MEFAETDEDRCDEELDEPNEEDRRDIETPEGENDVDDDESVEGLVGDGAGCEVTTGSEQRSVLGIERR